MSGILFISSNYTGYGHKSITQALEEQIATNAFQIRVEEVDGFSLGGYIPMAMSKMYNTVAVKLPLLWDMCYEFANITPSTVNFFSAKSIKNKLLTTIGRVNPDLIVSVHPGFVGATLEVLENANLHIPVISLIADLDNVSNLWADPRAEYILCPTEEARNSMLKLGIPDEKLKVFRFPVRSSFCRLNSENEPFNKRTIDKDRLTFLLMSGSQGASQVMKTSELLLKNYDCNVIIIAGRNNSLKESLKKKLLPLYKERVNILGFTKNIEEYMIMSDIMIIRASPNVLMESVNLCKPVIITGALTGQEKKNPEFVLKNNLGIVCKNINELPEAVNDLLSEGRKKLNEICNSQANYRNLESAKEIADFMFQIIDDRREKMIYGKSS